MLTTGKREREREDGCSIAYLLINTFSLKLEPLPPPNDVTLSAVGPDELTFSWENIAPNRSSLTYQIETSSGCGTCPSTADSTSITCSGIQLGSETRMCIKILVFEQSLVVTSLEIIVNLSLPRFLMVCRKIPYQNYIS